MWRLWSLTARAVFVAASSSVVILDAGRAIVNRRESRAIGRGDYAASRALARGRSVSLDRGRDVIAVRYVVDGVEVTRKRFDRIASRRGIL